MNIKSLAVWVALFLIIAVTHAQSIDSLQELLKAQNGNEKIETFYQVARKYLPDHPKLSLSYSRSGYMMALQNGDSLGMIKNGWVMGSALVHLQKNDSAILVFSRVVPLARRSGYNKLSLMLNSAATPYVHSGQYDKALNCFFESLELRTRARDTSAQVIVLTNIGAVYYKLKDYQRALDLFLRCRSLQLKTGDHYDADQIMLNAGHASAYLGRHGDALAQVDEALSLCDGECPANRFMQASFVKGVVYFGLQDLDAAEKFFLESYSISKEIDEIRFQLDNIDYLSQIYLLKRSFAKAADLLTAGEKLIESYRSFNLEKTKLYSRMSELYRAVKDYKNASHYQLQYAALRDSLYSEEMTNNLMRIESRFLERENLAQIASQNEIISLNRDIIRRQDIINALSIFLIVVSAGFLIIFYRNIQNRKRLNALLDDKVDERTRELNASHAAFMKTFRERDLMLNRSQKNYTRLTVRLDALCRMGLQDVSDPLGRDYIIQMRGLIQPDEQNINDE